ncbi:MAG: ATP-binding protein [Spirochaetaceae bacterium]|nr:MAG: ATP-binding protein [Spirochaetaceae bacterium]
MIPRIEEIRLLLDLLTRFPVVGIVGARQVGKTTLAHLLAERIHEPTTFFDLENPEDLARVQDPMLALKTLKGVVILDEIQRTPNLFSVLRVLADRPGTPCRFLVLGSASPDLLRQSSESLAGRIAYHHLGGLTVRDVGTEESNKLWRRGGMPRSFLAPNDTASQEWRKNFIRTFIERDLPQLGITVGATTLRRFWTMTAHYHGQIWNASEFARSFGLADTTVRHYLDVFNSALVVRLLLPWYENIKKRQIKSPKIYIRDSGMLHGLLNLTSQDDLESHPKVGASWEGYVIDQIVRHIRADEEECFFWSTYSGAELDLLVVRGSEKRGYEIKRTTSPKQTASMRSSIETLGLSSLDVIHAGDTTFPLAGNIRAVSFSRFLEDIGPLS